MSIERVGERAWRGVWIAAACLWVAGAAAARGQDRAAPTTKEARAPAARARSARTSVAPATSRANTPVAAEEPKGSGTRPGLEPPAESTTGAIELFVGGPGDIETLLKRLTQPDFVLLRGEEARAYAESKRAGATRAGEAGDPPYVVDAVAIAGTANDERVDLTATYGVVASAGAEGPVWVTVGLDGQTIVDASEAGRPIAVRAGARGEWQVEVAAGAHTVQVRFKARLKANAEGRRLDVAIPEAASTGFTIDVERRVLDATVGDAEPAAALSIRDGQATRLTARLTPRPRLELSWRVESEPGAQLPPLLSIRGEIALEVEAASLQTRSSWEIQSLRGAARSLQFVLDPGDEVLELELDGQPLPAGIDRGDGTAPKLTIPLFEPLRAGPSKRLVMTTRRAIEASKPFEFRGFPLVDAKEQSGAIGVAHGSNLWVDGNARRGLSRIDPRSELPAELRARPGTSLAYQFLDQPFELGLRVEPSRPLIRAEARTTIVLSAAAARVETLFDVRTARGRLFELSMDLPAGLELESVGPEATVATFQVSRVERGAERAASTRTLDGAFAAEPGRTLTIRPSASARDSGAFALRFVGRQAIDPTRPVELKMFRIRDTVSAGGRVVVAADRDLTVDLAGDDRASAVPSPFRAAVLPIPSDWPTPPGVRLDAASLWLRFDGEAETLALRVTPHRRTIEHETSLTLAVERGGVEVTQETSVRARFGTLESLDVLVPANLEGRWEALGSEIRRREDLGALPGGGRRVRLTLATSTDRARLRMRYRPPGSASLESGRGASFVVDWIRPAEGAALPTRATINSDPGLTPRLIGEGWRRDDAGESSGSAVDVAGAARLRAERDAGGLDPPLDLEVEVPELVGLPKVVVSRMWLRTTAGTGGELRTSARLRVETRGSALDLALPAGAEWVRARVAGETLGRIERLPSNAGYRLPLPVATRGAGGPILVELEFVAPAESSWRGTSWTPPLLLGGAVVERSLWDVRLPWNAAIVGAPAGWSDENTWYWDNYVFKRRPTMDSNALWAWTASRTSSEAGTLDEPAGRGDDHDYLFGAAGSPGPLRLWIVSRAGLVAVCSGFVLAAGVLLIFGKPGARPVWAATAGALLLAAAALRPSVAPAAAQAGLLGVLLALLAAWMHRSSERRRPRPAYGESVGSSRNTASALSPRTASTIPPAGSDDSTAIRVRPIATAATATTVDRQAVVPTEPPGSATSAEVAAPGEAESTRDRLKPRLEPGL